METKAHLAEVKVGFVEFLLKSAAVLAALFGVHAGAAAAVVWYLVHYRWKIDPGDAASKEE